MLWNVFADAKTTGIAAAGRTQSNLPKADLHLNFPLSTFNLKSLFLTLYLFVLKFVYTLKRKAGAWLQPFFF
ncbi:hypothetical protein DW091_02735 [Eubacterium sp. AM05-23]|nr:hypothetical protein DW091_02735 [Eubacterium sp. AM05-23]